MNVGEVYNLGFEDGAGTKPSVCIFGLHIPHSFKKMVIGDITGNVGETTTVTCQVKANYSDQDYFAFEVIDADGDNPIIRYYVWIDESGGGSDPVITGRTAIKADISGATSANDVGVIIAALIDALDDCGGANSSGVVTITNTASSGAVDDAWSSTTAFTIAVTVDGVSTKVITESITLPFIGFHDEKEESGEDIREDFVGATQTEYVWNIEEHGKLEENRTYLIAKNLAGSDLARPRGPDGLAYTNSQHPYPRYKNNFSWGDMTFTFTYNSAPMPITITGISISVIIEIDYKRNDGDDYSNARYVKIRDYEITITGRPTSTDLRDISKLHINDYVTDIALTVKAKRADDENDYIQWAFTKLRLLPFDMAIPGPGVGYDESDFILHGAPGNGTTVTIKGYLSQKYFGVA